ncbi:sulfotransferase family protein [Erythrobacter sp. EC-HK427]|uniref:sulfotransferase family protein n=1 Tax=Erythrobacter sp. EC-HK427 TaxID=2038396 RepID=UPI0018FEE332|nr:sulfotransferase [Erythrobacter sp. EC-HK427]
MARSPHVERANRWLESLWERGFANKPSLDPAVLWEKALKDSPAAGEAGGRSAQDVADFRERLIALTHALQAEARLNSLGLTIAHGQLVRVIRQRLELGALWASTPDVLAHPMAPPIIVVGQMRSGTTRVHRLLAADPAHAATRFCDSWLPVPRRPDTRPAWSALSLLAARTLDPWLDSIHPFGVTRADEELGWLACALDHCAYEAQWRIPSFSAWSEARDPAPVYREFARILRTDAHFHGNAMQPRVLKVPQFAEDLPALLEQFPEARLVMTKRCQDDLAASSASLVANQMTIQSDTPCIDWIRSEVQRKIALRQERMAEARAAFTGPVADVDFRDLDKDWEAAVARIYADLGLTLSPKALAAMQAEQRRACHSPHTEHAAQVACFDAD